MKKLLFSPIQFLFCVMSIILMITICSCSKNSDDPTIEDGILNITLTYSGAPGTNTDTSFKTLGGVKLSFLLQTTDDEKIINFDGFGSTEFLNDNNLTINGTTRGFLRTSTEGTLIDSTSALWLTGMTPNTGGLLYIKDINPLPGDSSGINGQGDKFIAFRKGSGSTYNYGWIKVNVSADANTLILKDIAYCTVTNKPIEIGDK